MWLSFEGHSVMHSFIFMRQLLDHHIKHINIIKMEKKTYFYLHNLICIGIALTILGVTKRARFCLQALS